MRRLDAKAAGLADQVLAATASAATGLLPYFFLPRSDVGGVLFALTVGFFVVGVTRAVVGDVLLTHSSRYDQHELSRQVTDAAATAFWTGVLAAPVAGLAWAFGPDYLRALVWLLPFLPFLLMHDAGRYTFLSARRPVEALRVDVIWVVAQGGALAVALGAGLDHGAVFLVTWGLGAVAGSGAFLIRMRVNPFAGRPRSWLRETRHLSGWFTGTAVIGQSQVQLVAILVVDLLGRPAFAALRLAQYGLLMPAMNLQLAVITLLVPRMSRLAHAGDATALRRLVRRALGMTVPAALVPMAAVPLAGPVLRAVLPEYVYVTPLALPVALQAGIYLLQVPLTAAMRGMQQARALFVQYGIFATSSLTGLVCGALLGGLTGAAWGLTAGSAVGFTMTLLLYRRAVARLAPAAVGPDPAPSDRPTRRP